MTIISYPFNPLILYPFTPLPLCPLKGPAIRIRGDLSALSLCNGGAG